LIFGLSLFLKAMSNQNWLEN